MLAEGVSIAGRYRLQRLLGEGGMASVWQAEDLRLERQVAVKFLDTKTGRDATEATEQFLREAKIAAAVQHRNVIQTVDFGTTDDGQPFMVMELLRGHTLAERIARHPPLEIDECVRIALLTMRGLAKVHEAGIVHRDLKPDNIFLVEDADGAFPKILDFGISRSVDPKSGRKSALTTSEGLIVGTPEYMSPEQARGLKDLDQRTDIYSMGAILYECITGTRPYESEHTGDLIIMVVNGGATPVIKLRPDVSPALSAAIAKAMSRKREDRYPDVRTMRHALEAATTIDANIADRRSRSVIPPSVRDDESLEYELPSIHPPAPGETGETGEVDTLQFREAVANTPTISEELVPVRNPSPTQNGIESWSEIQSAHGNPWKRRVVIGAAAMLVVTIGIWALAPQEEIQSTPIAAGPNTTPTPIAIEPHVVELEGLPAGSTILLDGKAAVGPHVQLPPGETAKHTIQVLAPGKLPWFVVHGAGSQHRYDVAMTDATGVAEPAPTATTKTKSTKVVAIKTVRAPTPTRPAVTTPAPTASTTKTTPRRTTKTANTPPTAFKNLDF